ncbi:hypothetical protein SmJEL517_g00991 [Synchytrium microbalum]|uniref:RRM domain-containing protein n=1 Tax=Synchytrium microbalum TaxID=1806994 RepID=A0A507CHR8_9FUNG|nr:uncharacterized protein SmJEL517_g00991 [Synchytrium microbalum]TPX37215.1 hypothetical protein SmJEL517_g00991 [Synchytrium microbalum]
MLTNDSNSTLPTANTNDESAPADEQPSSSTSVKFPINRRHHSVNMTMDTAKEQEEQAAAATSKSEPQSPKRNTLDTIPQHNDEDDLDTSSIVEAGANQQGIPLHQRQEQQDITATTGTTTSAVTTSTSCLSSVEASPTATEPHQSLVDVGSARILFVSNCRGKWSEINRLVDRTGASMVVHCGNFGFFVSNEYMKSKNLRQIVWGSACLSDNDRNLVHTNDTAAIRDMLSSRQFLSEMSDFASGRCRFSVPVHVVYGSHEDITIIDKLSCGDLSIPNLHLLHEGTPTRLPTQPPVLLMGLGGSLLPSSLYDHADGQLGHAGAGGLMWTTVLQIGQLVKDAMAVGHGDEVRVLVTSVDANEYSLCSQLAMTLEADYCVCPSMNSPIPTIQNGFQTTMMRQLYDKCVEFDAAYQRIFSKLLREQIEAKATEYQRVLLQTGESVIKKLPASRKDYSGWWNLLISDIASGMVMFDLQNYRISMQMHSEGIPYGNRVAKSPTTETTDAPRLVLPLSRSRSVLDSAIPGASPVPSLPNSLRHADAESTGRSSPAGWPDAESVSGSVTGTPLTLTPTPSMWHESMLIAAVNDERASLRHGRGSALQIRHPSGSVTDERIGWETDSDDSEGSWDPPTGSMTVWVGNLPEDVTDEDVVTFFKNIPIMRVKISSRRPDRRPTAYVDVPHADALERVLRCSGERIRGSRLKIEYDPTRLAKIRDARASKRESRRQSRAASVESTPVVSLSATGELAGIAPRPGSTLAHRRPAQLATIPPRHENSRKGSISSSWRPDISAPPYVPESVNIDHGSPPLAPIPLPPSSGHPMNAYPRSNAYLSVQHPPRFGGGPTSAPATAAPWREGGGGPQSRSVSSSSSRSDYRPADPSPQPPNSVLQTAAPAGWKNGSIPMATWDSPPRKNRTSFSTGAHWDRPHHDQGPVAVVGWETSSVVMPVATAQMGGAGSGYSWSNNSNNNWTDESWATANTSSGSWAGANDRNASWNSNNNSNNMPLAGGMAGAASATLPHRSWNASPAANVSASVWVDGSESDHGQWTPPTPVSEEDLWRMDAAEHAAILGNSNSNSSSSIHSSSKRVNSFGGETWVGADTRGGGGNRDMSGGSGQPWERSPHLLSNSALPPAPWSDKPFINNLPRPSSSAFTAVQPNNSKMMSGSALPAGGGSGWSSTASSPRRHSIGGGVSTTSSLHHQASSSGLGNGWDAAGFDNVQWKGQPSMQPAIGGLVSGASWTWK